MARALTQPGQGERQRRVRRSTLAYALVAAAFYVGFIVLMLLRATR
ncbi:MAG: hypothetical protein JO361_00795 [Gammaproteobacteria bacterium]|nr:hypothetical protein [Gammaproteobacteria bacterium]